MRLLLASTILIMATAADAQLSGSDSLEVSRAQTGELKRSQLDKIGAVLYDQLRHQQRLLATFKGMVSYFPGTCPEGWSVYTDLQGRVAVGTPAGGNHSRTVGTALANGASRYITDVPAHSHQVNPPSTNTSTAGSHIHRVDPPSTSTSRDGSHVHHVNPAKVNTTTNGAHEHTMYTPPHSDNGAKSQGWPAWRYHSVRASDRGRSYAIEAGAMSRTGSHSHSVDIPNTKSTSSGVHTHKVNIAAFDSSRNGNHSHSVDIETFNSHSTGKSRVDVTMPYLQLQPCQFQGIDF